MAPSPELPTQLVAWNGMRLVVPPTWETRVGGDRCLLFEEDFRPQLQIRWEAEGQVTAKKLRRHLRGLLPEKAETIPVERAGGPWRRLARVVDQLNCFADPAGTVVGGFFVCRKNATLVLFNCLETTGTTAVLTGDLLAHLSCEKGETLWRLQDFSLTTPAAFLLRQYTFAAGLTRLSLASPAITLDGYRLAAAAHRLARQPLAEILSTLTGAEDLAIVPNPGRGCCDGLRHPPLARQIRLRLRRERPFIRARIRHDLDTDRLFALILKGKTPFDATLLDYLDRRYEHVPPTRQAPSPHPD